MFNVQGRLVRTLLEGHRAADVTPNWDGRDEGGTAVSSGVYFPTVSWPWEPRSGG